MLLTPVSEEDLTLHRQRTIASQMPVLFPHGSRLDAFTGYCQPCGAEIPVSLFRGLVTVYPDVAVIRAVGVCPRCNVGTRFLSRVYTDLSIVQTADGKWMRWAPRVCWTRIAVHRFLARLSAGHATLRAAVRPFFARIAPRP